MVDDIKKPIYEISAVIEPIQVDINNS